MLSAFPPTSVNVSLAHHFEILDLAVTSDDDGFDHCLQVWITVTAFLHLLVLKDNTHQAEAQDKRPRQRPLTHENAQPSSVSRAEILGTNLVFLRRGMTFDYKQ